MNLETIEGCEIEIAKHYKELEHENKLPDYEIYNIEGCIIALLRRIKKLKEKDK